MRGGWLFFVQHKNADNKERGAPATRQGVSGSGFGRKNSEAVCVAAALLIAPCCSSRRAKRRGGGLKEDFADGLCGS